MEADIRKLSKRTAGENDSDDEHTAKKAKKSMLAEELSKYAGGRGRTTKSKRKEEDDIMGMLNSFRTKLQQTSAPPQLDGDGDVPGAEVEAGQEDEAANFDDPGIEVDDDSAFLTHALRFDHGNEEEVAKAERDYEVIDPRVRGARAKEEEKERKAKDHKNRPPPGAPRRR
jgi:peptidyl-prolyl cis-trans isomerase SDCCAG10